ncbi:MAG: HAD family hydrolase [Deltaproteobacteria bacterium]|nr:HAD family hydrolase [Deltaproteobacteria bacterium]
MPYRAVLLDVDGTLVDSNDAHARAWVEVLAWYGCDVAYERVRSLIGMGGDKLVEAACGVARESELNERIGKARMRLFLERYLGTVRPQPGARDLVLRLRDLGCRVAIASAAKTEELDALLAIAGVADLVGARATSSEVEESKPAPDTVGVALGKVGGDRAEAVLVGDTPYDLRAARDAGIAMIALTCGGWPEAAFPGAVATFATPAALAAGFAALATAPVECARGRP